MHVSPSRGTKKIRDNTQERPLLSQFLTVQENHSEKSETFLWNHTCRCVLAFVHVYVFVHVFAPNPPWYPRFMRPPLRCGECWTEWAAPPALGRSAWSVTTASQTLLWSAARRLAAPRGQRSPLEGLRLHPQTTRQRWHHTLHQNTYLVSDFFWRCWDSKANIWEVKKKTY